MKTEFLDSADGGSFFTVDAREHQTEGTRTYNTDLSQYNEVYVCLCTRLLPLLSPTSFALVTAEEH